MISTLYLKNEELLIKLLANSVMGEPYHWGEDPATGQNRYNRCYKDKCQWCARREKPTFRYYFLVWDYKEQRQAVLCVPKTMAKILNRAATKYADRLGEVDFVLKRAQDIKGKWNFTAIPVTSEPSEELQQILETYSTDREMVGTILETFI